MLIHSLEDDTGIHCVDVAEDENGTFTFKVFRKDPEDQGRWTLVADFSKTVHASEADAFEAAGEKIPWVADVISKRLKQAKTRMEGQPDTAESSTEGGKR